MTSSPAFSIVLLLLSCQITRVTGFWVAEEDRESPKEYCYAIPIFDSVGYAAGMNIELPCKCMPDTHPDVSWYYKHSVYEETELLSSYDEDGKKIPYHVGSKITTKLYSVIIHNAQVEDSGLYICGFDGAFLYGYNVDMQDFANALVAFSERNQHPQKDLVTEKFTAFTAFWEWSVCDRCDVPGEQTRIGLCHVQSTYLDPKYTRGRYVAPCGSHGVPAEFKQQLSLRRPEIFIRRCETKCNAKPQGHSLHAIRDWLLRKKDSLGLYLLPTEKHTHLLGQSLTLHCLGAKPGDAVAWDKGTRRFYKSDYMIGQHKAKRVYIDHGNHLKFRHATLRDSGKYYCWLQGQLKVAIGLSIEVNPREQRTFTDPESVMAWKIIGCSFFIFFIIFVVGHILKCCVYRCCPSLVPLLRI